MFGRVVSGLEVLEKMDGCGTPNGKPKKKIRIAECGEVPATTVADTATTAPA